MRQNYIARTDTKRMIVTQIEHVALSDNGEWMATVEQRDDKQTVAELRLKFWEFSAESQRYFSTVTIFNFLQVQS